MSLGISSISLVTIGGGSSVVYGINDAGTAVADFYQSSTLPALDSSTAATLSAFWDNSPSLTLTTSFPFDTAYAVNAKGDVAGFAITGGGSGSPGPAIQQAVLILSGSTSESGVFSILTQLSSGIGAVSQAFGINDQDAVVGYATSGSDASMTYGAQHAVLWQNGGVTDLGTLPGANPDLSGGGQVLVSVAKAINDADQIVGSSLTTGNIRHAFEWQNGQMTDLGALASGSNSDAMAISANGLVVGSSGTAGGATHAVSWQNGVVTDLGVLPGFADSSADAANESGDIVGSSTSADGTVSHAVIWENGQITDLNSLLPTNSGWVLQAATGINDQDQVTGYGIFNGTQQGFVLTLGSTAIPDLSVQQALQAVAAGVGGSFAISDSAANVVSNLDSLETAMKSGKIDFIALTDSGTPNLTLTAAQMQAAGIALNSISTSFTVTETAPDANNAFYDFLGHGVTVALSGSAAQYNVKADANGTSLDITNGSVTYTAGITDTALQFSDVTGIVAQTPGTGGVVTTGNITELYAAILDREPDIGGLAYYQNALKFDSSTSLLTFAQYFLASPEYTGNAEHNYAQSATGDAQFITDSYNNLLHRAPEGGAIPFYQNVINQYTQSLVPGTAAYAQAQTLGHAMVLVYFSASAEFLGDVQVTAQQPASAQHWLVLV